MKAPFWRHFSRGHIEGHKKCWKGQLTQRALPPHWAVDRNCPAIAANQCPFAGPHEVGRSSGCLVKEVGELAISVEVSSAVSALKYPNRAEHFQAIMIGLYQALALVELKAPQSAQGSFIPVGNAFDAYAAMARILGAAASDVLMVDPYMDDSVLTDFAGSVQSSFVPLRLLTDQAICKPNLSPAAIRWKAQYPRRPLECGWRHHPNVGRNLRIDKMQAWTVTRSLKKYRRNDHLPKLRADDTATLKIAAYEAIWLNSAIVT